MIFLLLAQVVAIFVKLDDEEQSDYSVHCHFLLSSSKVCVTFGEMGNCRFFR